MPPIRAAPGHHEQYGGPPGSRASPLEPLDNIFNESSEEYSQRYLGDQQGQVPGQGQGPGQGPGGYAQHPNPPNPNASGNVNVNVPPGQEYSQRSEPNPEAGVSYRYGGYERQGRPAPSPGQAQGPVGVPGAGGQPLLAQSAPPPGSSAPRHWTQHQAPPHSRPSAAAGYPPRHAVAGPVATVGPGGGVPPGAIPQDSWYVRDAQSSTTSQPSPQRRPMLPQQQYESQFAPVGSGGAPGLPPRAGPGAAPEGFSYSPQPQAANPYGAYAPQYYPPQRSLYPEHYSPDPRHAPYSAGYSAPSAPYSGYYEQQSRFLPPPHAHSQHLPPHPHRNALDEYNRGAGAGYIPAYGSTIPSQMPQFTTQAYIKDVNENDVLCGRGGATNSHSGNRSYRELVKQYKDKYLQAKKKQKPNVAAEVVAKIRNLEPPGRFLKKDKESGWYLDIGDARAKEKTSQALREGAPLIRKQMSEGRRPGMENFSSDDGASPERTAGTSVTARGTSVARSQDSGSDNATTSIFSPHQSETVHKGDLSADTNAATGNSRKPPDNREETTPVADEKYQDSKQDKEGDSKKRDSPSKPSSEEFEGSGESPLKRQMTKPTGGGTTKRPGNETANVDREDSFRDVFEPPRANSIREEDTEKDKTEETKPVKKKDNIDEESSSKSRQEVKKEDEDNDKDKSTSKTL